jgi:hypothetical protein
MVLRTASHLATLLVVIGGWILFRTSSLAEAADYLWGILVWQPGVSLPSPQILSISVVITAAHFVIPKNWDWVEHLPERALPVRIGAYATLLFMMTTLAGREVTPFLYFQF